MSTSSEQSDQYDGQRTEGDGASTWTANLIRRWRSGPPHTVDVREQIETALKSAAAAHDAASEAHRTAAAAHRAAADLAESSSSGAQAEHHRSAADASDRAANIEAATADTAWSRALAYRERT